MKITGTSNDAEQLVDSVEAGTAVGELDIGEDQSRPLLLGQRHRFGMGAGDADDLVAEALDQRLDVHGDERLVFDDQDVGGDFGGEFAAGFLDQAAQASAGRSPGSSAASSSEKPSRATSRKACRGRGVICVRCCSGGSAARRRRRPSR